MKRGRQEVPTAELEVLDALWRRGKGTVRDVLEELETRGRRLAYTTVLTLLGRLERRGYVEKSREGPAHVFTPRRSRDEVAAERVGPLVRDLASGEAVPLILHLVEAQRLSPEELRRLREHLGRLEDEAQRRRRR